MARRPEQNARSKDPAVGLRAVAALRRLADDLEPQHVQRARAQGMSWEAIGAYLEVSRQGLHKKYAGTDRDPAPIGGRHGHR